MKRQPTYGFLDELETGINQVPIGSIIVVSSTGKSYVVRDLTGVDANTTITSFLSVPETHDTIENTLGNPTTDGYILSSTISGTRSWIAPQTGGEGGQVNSIVAGTNVSIDSTDGVNPIVNVPDMNYDDTSIQAEVTLNTAKVGITTTQANDITANNLKVGITTQQANDITTNNAKTGITTQQSSDITANNDKAGITAQQTTDITTNNAKVGITPTQASDIGTNNDKISYSDAALVAQHTTDIGTNNAKISYGDAATVAQHTTDIGTNTTDIGNKEESLGDPVVDGDVLSSLIDGTRSWITIPASSVTSVNTKTGVVTLDTDDINEGSTNLYYTDTRADARVQTAIVDSSASSTTLYSSEKIEAIVTGSLAYKGAWDASTNTPTLSDGTGTLNDFYKVSVTGNQDLGSGTITFTAGDDVIHNGTVWQDFHNANAVDSVNTKVGTVVLGTDDIVEGATNLWYTDTRVDARLPGVILDSAETGITDKTWSADKLFTELGTINSSLGGKAAQTDLDTTNGIVSGKEPDLGIAGTAGYVLSDDGAGIRSWIEQSTGAAPTGLEKVGDGYQFVGSSSTITLGMNAVDLAYDYQNTRGAKGQYSFTCGSQAEANANYSISLGSQTKCYGQSSIAAGDNTYVHADADYAGAFGRGTRVNKIYSFAFGHNSLTNAPDCTAVGSNNLGLTNTRFEVGTGSDSNDRINGLEVYTLGEVVAPSLTEALITTEATGKVLTTREWVENNAGGTSSSGLEALDEGFGVGWRLIGKDPAAHSSLGNNAIDFTLTNTLDNNKGAKGTCSVAFGFNTRADGNYSFTTGQNAVASHTYSIASGVNVTASGYASVAIGQYTKATGDFSFANGYRCSAINPNQTSIGKANGSGSTESITGTILEVGNGAAYNDRSNAFEVYLAGEVVAPDLTEALINAESSGKVLVTKEWVTANSGGVSELEKVGSGWRVLGLSPTTPGTDAISLSKSNGPGATGTRSFTAGYYASASGQSAIAIGNSCVATGSNSTAIGFGTQSTQDNLTALGKYNKSSTPLTILEVGNGTSGTTSNAFEIYLAGEIVAPDVTNALIDAEATGKILVTKEWVTANSGGGGGDFTDTDTVGDGVTTTFSIAYTVGKIQVFVDGLRIKNDLIDTSSGTEVVFTNIPANNAWILFTVYS